MKSLKTQLIVWIVGLLTVVGVLASSISFYFARDEANSFLDHQLQEIAWSVDEGSQLPAMQAGFLKENKQQQQRDFVIQVWVEKNPVVSSRPGFDLPRMMQSGFSDIIWNNAQWRVYTMVHTNRTVQISQAEDVRFEIATQSAMWVLFPVVMLIPLSWLLVGVAVSRLLKPLVPPFQFASASLFCSNSFTTFGFACPLVSFMTCPTKKPSTLVFPERYSSSCLGFADRILSITALRLPSSLT